MTEFGTQAHASSLSAVPHEFTEPLLYLSSTQAGWEGLVAQAFHEPRELEGWVAPATTDISLILFAGGPIYIEARQAQGSWNGITIRHGDLILNPGRCEPSEVRWKSLSSVPTQTLHLSMSRESVRRAAEEVTGANPERLVLTGDAGFQDPLLEQIALALWQELKQPTPAGKLYAQTAAQLLAVHLVRHYAASIRWVRGTPPAPGAMTARQIKQVREFIQLHLGEDLSLEAVAQEIGFSSYHFARLFRRTMGVTLHQFVLRQRIEYAQWLLRETGVPLAQVALACGFSDQSHLTLIFKQQLGCTPRAYRRFSRKSLPNFHPFGCQPDIALLLQIIWEDGLGCEHLLRAQLRLPLQTCKSQDSTGGICIILRADLMPSTRILRSDTMSSERSQVSNRSLE